MEMSIFSVWDEKAVTYATPFFTVNDETGVRAFAQACNDPSTMLNQNPADFRLYKVGLFDMDTGEVKPLDKPKFIEHAEALIVKKVKESDNDDNC